MEKVVYFVLAWVAIGFLIALALGKILREAETSEAESVLTGKDSKGLNSCRN